MIPDGCFFTFLQDNPNHIAVATCLSSDHHLIWGLPNLVRSPSWKTLKISVFKPEWFLVSLAKQLWGHTCLVTCHAQHDPCKVTQVSCSDVYGVGSMDGDEGNGDGFDGWCCLCRTPYGFSPERRHPFNTTLKVWNDLDGSQKIKEFEAFDP